MEHAVEAADMFIDGFEIFDAVRLPADIGVNGDGKDFCPLFSLGIKALELVQLSGYETRRPNRVPMAARISSLIGLGLVLMLVLMARTIQPARDSEFWVRSPVLGALRCLIAT